LSILDTELPTLAEKVEFLRTPESHGKGVADVTAIETHMSWVFLVGGTVFKLKKPVKFPYLDYSTLNRRETACRAEQTLNRRLAPTVYLSVAPLRLSPRGLSIDAGGEVVDWLVVMRRLDETLLLDRAISTRSVSQAQVDRVAECLVTFYRTAQRPFVSRSLHLREWQRDVAFNHSQLLNPHYGLPNGLVWRIDRAQRRFLAGCGELLAGRVKARRIVYGHGDLRPEHVWLGEPPQIIDCLEFSARLRIVDPFHEIGYLGLECERLGLPWIGERITQQLSRGLHDNVPDSLFRFYRCYRATLRARLAIAHLHEPHVRTPEKWPALARTYLQIAEAEAALLERALKTRADRPLRGLRVSF
jgi:aminoglycoside phosphotransferase family enzyme